MQETADASTTMALNTQPRPASNGIPAMTSDEYAMTQINFLATARAYLFAVKVVEEEYKRLTTPEKAVEAEDKPKKGNVY